MQRDRKLGGLVAALLGLLAIQNTHAYDPLVDQPIASITDPATVIELAIPSNGDRMPGHLYVADGAGPHPTFVLLHGLPGNEKNLDVAQVLRRAGFNVLFFHYRGAWGAEGEYRLSQLDDDALAVLDFIRQPDNATNYRIDLTRLSLLGHSMGGFAALAAGRRDAELVCVGAMSPSNLGLDKRALDLDPQSELDGLASYADQLFMLRGFNGDSLRKDLASQPLAQWDIPSFAEGLRGKSVLLVVGDKDDVTPERDHLRPAADAYQAAGVAVERRVIAGDHSFSANRLGLTRVMLDWAMGRCR